MASANTTKLQIFARLSSTLIILPSIPITYWYYTTKQERADHLHNVQTKVRPPSYVQTVDDLMLEQIKPGDVVLFDRKCHLCAAGPLAALGCILGRAWLCGKSSQSQSYGPATRGGGGGMQFMQSGSFDHCGVVVPSPHSKTFEAGELYLLEATAGGGVIQRPLLARLEASRSRTVLLLPLSVPGSSRRPKSSDSEPESNAAEPDQAQRMQNHISTRLTSFAHHAILNSQQSNYPRIHALSTCLGATLYHFHIFNLLSSSSSPPPTPVSPSAWLTVSALQASGVAANLNQRDALEAKVEDFFRDARFQEEDVVRLRPGFKFRSPVVLRETSKS